MIETLTRWCRSCRASLALLACAAVFAGSDACAQTPAPPPAHGDRDRIVELERRLDDAMRQLQQLREALLDRQIAVPATSATTGAGATAPAVATTSAPPSTPPGGELAAKVARLEQEAGAQATARGNDDRGIALHGFADVGLAAGSKRANVGGNVGSLDFYLTPAFGDRVKSLIELNFEVNPQGSVSAELERLQVGYTVADELTLWLGRFHTPLGYWNTAFHHGAQIQTSIRRPKFLEFEDLGGILPAHTVGLWGTGGVRLGAGRVNYDVYAGNAPTIELEDAATAGTGTLDIGLNGARRRHATVGANLSYSFAGTLGGLTLGAHALTSRVVDSFEPPGQTRLRVFGGWLTYLEQDWEVLGEWYAFRNRTLGNGTHRSNAGYLQAGRTFGNFTPFARYERSALDQGDLYFAQLASGQSYRRMAFGVRYDLNPSAALKFEALRTTLTDRLIDNYSEVRAQWAIRF